jgi:hypothetical protein
MHHPVHHPAPAAPKPELVAPCDTALPAAPWVLAIAAVACAALAYAAMTAPPAATTLEPTAVSVLAA